MFLTLALIAMAGFLSKRIAINIAINIDAFMGNYQIFNKLMIHEVEVLT
jgi:hypothetical protein